MVPYGTGGGREVAWMAPASPVLWTPPPSPVLWTPPPQPPSPWGRGFPSVWAGLWGGVGEMWS